MNSISFAHVEAPFGDGAEDPLPVQPPDVIAGLLGECLQQHAIGRRQGRGGHDVKVRQHVKDLSHLRRRGRIGLVQPETESAKSVQAQVEQPVVAAVVADADSERRGVRTYTVSRVHRDRGLEHRPRR